MIKNIHLRTLLYFVICYLFILPTCYSFCLKSDNEELEFSSFIGEFTSIWDTTQPGSSANNEIIIPTNPAFTYNYTVDWGDGSSNTGVTGDITHTYATAGSYTVKISGAFPAIYFNDTGDKEKIIEILEWGIIEWQTMENAFYGCENLNFDAIDSPDLSRVTSLKNMFRDCDVFNGIVNNWDISTVTDISGMFSNTRFNRPLANWNTSRVTDMSETFQSSNFNEPLDSWNTSSVTNMSRMFNSATSFNQNINAWNVSNVINMSRMFEVALRYNNPMDNWNVANVTTMFRMFYRAREFDQPLNSWNVGKVTNMSEMFAGFLDMIFNQPLNNWNVENVETMSAMFFRCASFNQPLDNWNVQNVTDMSRMFERARAFDQSLNDWDVSNVTNMKGMFSGDNRIMIFNQPLSNWVVNKVTDMSEMFKNCTAFDQPLTTWNVSSVTNMEQMFFNASQFNQSINNWTTTSLNNITSMFFRATLFNQPLDNWDVDDVTAMNNTFNQATAFNQNLASWNVTSVEGMANMLNNTGMTQENYDNTLIGWASQNVMNDVSLGALNLTYCNALTVRQELIDDHNWTISGDAVNCSFVLCTSIISPVNGDTNVPANSDIRWNPAPNATGYFISIRRENDAGDIIQVIYDNEDVGNVVGVDFTNEFIPGDNVFITVIPYNDEGPAVGCEEIQFKTVESWVNSPDAFKFTVDTRNLDRSSSAANQLIIETVRGYDFNFSIDWGDNQYDNNVTNEITHTYLIPGIYTIAIIGDYPAHSYGRTDRDNKKLISVDQWGTQPWQTMQQAFWFCDNMEYNAIDVPDLSNVISMARMFRRNKLFNGNINNWDVSNVTNMANLFYQAEIFNQPLDNWDVSNVTTMTNMFNTAKAFNQPLNTWDVGNVTNMSDMFNDSEAFDQPLNRWNVAKVTTTKRMFANARSFNQSLNNWDVSNVEEMEEMFSSAEVFNGELNSWTMGKVTTMRRMFYNAKQFNQPLDLWDVSTVIDMQNMFNITSSFNQPLNTWDVSNVTNMSSMFRSANSFNQPLDQWQVTSVVNMSSMFSYASSFNQNINNWAVTNVRFMGGMFEFAIAYNQPLFNWDVNSVVTMNNMFRGATVFNQPIGNWNVSAVASMNSMFEDAIAFNQPLNTWDVSSVTLMQYMFKGTSIFDNPISNWEVASVTNMEGMFKDAILFNQPLENWNTEEVLNMKEMFSGATVFNQNLDSWNVSFVTTMEEMFRNATAYNQAMDSWNVASVTTMKGMFQGATTFNEVINNWNVRGVLTMSSMFNGASAFNQSLNGWRINGVQNMDFMFVGALAYNQAMDTWNIGNVSMRSMFQGASTFNQSLDSWNVSNVSNMRDMLDNTALTRENYDNTLIAWSTQALTSGINFGAETLPYCDSIEERQSMIDTYGWVFTGDIRDCPIPECTQLISPENGAVDIPVNTNLVWSPALYATEYDLTITLLPSNVVINQTVSTEFYEFAVNTLVGSTGVRVLIEPKNDEGIATGCVAETFSLSMNSASVPGCTMLTRPSANSTDVEVDVDLFWGAIANADGYFLTIGTSAGSSDILNNEDVGNVTTFDLSNNLPEDTEIFVTLTPYNEQGNATGCTEESFTTELIPVAPLCTTISNPLNDAINVPVNTNLSWNSSDGATGYLVRVGTTPGGIEIANNIDVKNVTTYDFPSDLSENRTFYVTITPYNGVGDAIGCLEENFRTGGSTLNTPPICTTLITPLNGAVDIGIDTNLTWNGSANADGYKVTVGTTAGGTDILNNFDVNNVTTYDLMNDLPEGEEIFVTITPYNSFGDATGCNEESFTIETTAVLPGCTTLTTPTNGARNIALDTNLAWNTITDALGYRISAGTTSGGVDIVDNQDVSNMTTFDFPNDLPENTEIFVTITPYNAVGNATGCIEESFSTETLSTGLGCTTLTSPTNGARNVSTDTNLDWDEVADATGYRISAGTTSGGNDIVNNQNVSGMTTFDFPNDLPENTEIFVTITPYNAVGNASGCIEESFTTENMTIILGCTTLTTPTNGARNVSIDTNLDWDEVADATGYRISAGTTSGGNDVVDNQDVSNMTTFDLQNDLPENTEIFVVITPYNAAGDATGCIEESFTTENPIIVVEDNIKYGFSPDGDGINEFWEIDGIENYPDNTVSIYNRWGDMVFKISGYNNTSRVFRGDANRLTNLGGGQLPEGTYFFNINIPQSNTLKKLKGFLVLKR
ncbi:BspA family leucine-rich repeat surface protein [Aquimarina algiphila]|uniref:BspA family leucine-rich repeat surface protein n=1 Tax=Aquimarina algiphila TaxID=2047982 RepID=A0A554VCX9_9FLAO|nr:BspA family leucine-rich repeat surface protein [Aquimarina algiphila]TSE04664.1 BspA family leucine-rich repeat surface protein [Aquimarina algiphila]